MAIRKEINYLVDSPNYPSMELSELYTHAMAIRDILETTTDTNYDTVLKAQLRQILELIQKHTGGVKLNEAPDNGATVNMLKVYQHLMLSVGSDELRTMNANALEARLVLLQKEHQRLAGSKKRYDIKATQAYQDAIEETTAALTAARKFQSASTDTTANRVPAREYVAPMLPTLEQPANTPEAVEHHSLVPFLSTPSEYRLYPVANGANERLRAACANDTMYQEILRQIAKKTKRPRIATLTLPTENLVYVFHATRGMHAAIYGNGMRMVVLEVMERDAPSNSHQRLLLMALRVDAETGLIQEIVSNYQTEEKIFELALCPVANAVSNLLQIICTPLSNLDYLRISGTPGEKDEDFITDFRIEDVAGHLLQNQRWVSMVEGVNKNMFTLWYGVSKAHKSPQRGDVAPDHKQTFSLSEVYTACESIRDYLLHGQLMETAQPYREIA